MIHETFREALRWAVTGPGKRGKQSYLAKLMGIGASQISDCIGGRRGFPEEKRRLVANLLGFEYEHFLQIGRALLRGEEPPESASPHHALTDHLNVNVLLFGEWSDRPDIPLEDYYAAPRSLTGGSRLAQGVR